MNRQTTYIVVRVAEVESAISELPVQRPLHLDHTLMMVGMAGNDPAVSRPRTERITFFPHPDWSGWPVSIRRPSRPQRDALPTELQPDCRCWSEWPGSNPRSPGSEPGGFAAFRRPDWSARQGSNLLLPALVRRAIVTPLADGLDGGTRTLDPLAPDQVPSPLGHV